MVESRRRSDRLNPGTESSEAESQPVTDEVDDAQPNDTTVEPRLPDAITKLGIEAQAEYLRARERLGLSLGPVAQLGTVGRYRLEQEIGRGGMGIVYRARDPELDRPIAIKLVQAKPLAHYDKLRARLLREAKVLAKLTHPNVVRVYDCGQHQGEVYLAMEYVEGSTLRQWQEGRPHRSVLDAYAKAARGLAAAHDLGIVHRDFKPDNVLVASDGRVLVGDFGLAGLPAGDETRSDEGSSLGDSRAPRGSTTRTGTLLGTPTYMAPEQLRGEGAIESSDQFAFCVSLWEALTGRRPFEGEHKEELLAQIEQRRVVGVEAIPRRLRGLLLKGLATDPAARFGHVRDLAEAIRPRRSPAIMSLVMLLTLATGLVVGWLLEGKTAEVTDCDLMTSLAKVEELSRSPEIRKSFDGLLPSYVELRSHIGDLKEEAKLLCRSDVDPSLLARRQQVEGWIAYLEHMLEKAPRLGAPMLVLVVDDLENMLSSVPPPVPLDPRVDELLGELRIEIADNEPDKAMATAKKAIVEAGSRELELAAAHRWRGRALALLTSRSAEALDAYLQALDHTEAAAYDPGRPDLELLIAEIAVMRCGRTELAEEALRHIPGLFRRFHEPWLSGRRSDYHEIKASILKRRGEFRSALDQQRRALLIRYLKLDIREIANGHVNLGTIHERSQSDGPSLARLHYGFARWLLDMASLRQSPEWLQAAYNLGHWLANDPQDCHRAEGLLEEVRRRSADLQVYALTDIVLAKTTCEDPSAARAAQELVELLSQTSSISEEKVLDAWATIAGAYSMTHDLPAFESARDRLVHLVEHADDANWRLAALDLTAADALQGFVPIRSRELAESARAHLLKLPEEQRPAEMLKAANALIR